MDIEKGTLYWVTGLSGAGKTTMGTLLYDYIKAKKDNVVFLDGDILRQVIATNDYSEEGRRRIALQYSRMCKMLTDQNIDVICCVIAMFRDCREWNRRNIANYQEIYIKVPMEELIRRDQKKLYSRALAHEISNVMGIDIDFDEPTDPEVLIWNDSSKKPEVILKELIKKLGI